MLRRNTIMIKYGKIKERCELKKLPIVDSPIKGYTIHSYPLSIMLNEPRSYEWFYSNYIQVVCNRLFDENFFDFKNICSIIDGDEWINWLYPGNPWIKCETIVLYKDYYKEIYEIIIWAIKQNEYVVITLDEYYLPNKQNYKANHNLHEILCYGYDETDSIIYTLTFDQRGIFQEVKVNYSDLQNAYESVREICNDKENRINPIKLLSINKNFSFQFNLDLVYQLLIDYIKSRDTIGLVKQVYPNNLNLTYGINTYELLGKYYSYGRKYYDIRPLHILYEHKKCMVMRLEYMRNLFNDETFNNIIEGYQEIQKMCLLAKRLLIKYMYTSNWINDINKLIESIYKMEQQQLYKLIKNLEKYFK